MKTIHAIEINGILGRMSLHHRVTAANLQNCNVTPSMARYAKLMVKLCDGMAEIVDGWNGEAIIPERRIHISGTFYNASQAYQRVADTECVTIPHILPASKVLLLPLQLYGRYAKLKDLQRDNSATRMGQCNMDPALIPIVAYWYQEHFKKVQLVCQKGASSGVCLIADKGWTGVEDISDASWAVSIMDYIYENPRHGIRQLLSAIAQMDGQTDVEVTRSRKMESQSGKQLLAALEILYKACFDAI